MLKVEKFLFILSSGIFSYLAVFIAQKVIFKHAFLNRGLIMKLAGVGVLLLGIISLRNI